MGQAWSNLVARRSAKALRELAPQKTPGHDAPLPQLDRDTLLAALHNVSAYIASKKQNITIIAVGGAVNTIHLQSRTSTHDIDFFNNFLSVADYGHLVAGARAAAGRDGRLREEWFNNRTILFIPRERRELLTQQAFAQGEAIFSAPGLTVLAAPWNYAFCCKIDRLSGGGLYQAKEYDLDDAVQYLHRHLANNGLTHISGSTVQAWFAEYSLRWTPAVQQLLEGFNQAYRAMFGITYDVIM